MSFFSKGKNSLVSFASRTGLFRGFELFERGRVRILMYHRFTADTHPHRISASAFEEHLRYLAARANVISLDRAVDALKGEGGLPPYPVVITIDDGYRDAYEIAYPLLKKYGLPATVYAVTGLMDGKCWLWTDVARYLLHKTKKTQAEFEVGGRAFSLTPANGGNLLETAGKINDQLKEMPDGEKEDTLRALADELKVTLPDAPTDDYSGITTEQAREMDRAGISIESHTLTHPMMTQVDAERMLVEARDSKAQLEGILGREVRHFCYPNGAFNSEAAEAARRAGYASAVSTRFGSCRKGDDVFTLSRLAAEADLDYFLQSLSGLETFKQRVRSLAK